MQTSYIFQIIIDMKLLTSILMCCTIYFSSVILILKHCHFIFALYPCDINIYSNIQFMCNINMIKSNIGFCFVFTVNTIFYSTPSFTFQCEMEAFNLTQKVALITGEHTVSFYQHSVYLPNQIISVIQCSTIWGLNSFIDLYVPLVVG